MQCLSWVGGTFTLVYLGLHTRQQVWGSHSLAQILPAICILGSWEQAPLSGQIGSSAISPFVVQLWLHCSSSMQSGARGQCWHWTWCRRGSSVLLRIPSPETCLRSLSCSPSRNASGNLSGKRIPNPKWPILRCFFALLHDLHWIGIARTVGPQSSGALVVKRPQAEFWTGSNKSFLYISKSLGLMCLTIVVRGQKINKRRKNWKLNLFDSKSELPCHTKFGPGRFSDN